MRGAVCLLVDELVPRCSSIMRTIIAESIYLRCDTFELQWVVLPKVELNLRTKCTMARVRTIAFYGHISKRLILCYRAFHQFNLPDSGVDVGNVRFIDLAILAV